MRSQESRLGGYVLLTLSVAIAACGVGLNRDEIAARTDDDHLRAERARYSAPANRAMSDSSFVFEFGSCIRYTYNSTSGLLTRNQGSHIDPERPREIIEQVDSTQIVLTSAEIRAILADADRIDLWSYPADFGDSLTVNPALDGWTQQPYQKFRVDVRSGDKSAIVRWSDKIRGSLTPEAEALRQFGYELVRTVREQPGFKTLSANRILCL